MSLKELIQINRGISLPIQDGNGSSIDDPIVIENSDEYSCVNVEYALLDYFSDAKGIKWKLIEQQIITHEKKRIDILKIETNQSMEQEIITKIENYYFDITDCYEDYKKQ